jgi:hypothetical protein
VIGLLFLAAAVALGCRSSTETGERRVESAALVTDPRHDFGRVVQGATLRHGFDMHNRSARVLTVENAGEVLGCSGLPVPRVLEADRHGTFEVTCRANVYGPLRVSLPLRANALPAGELTLVAEVEPLLVFDRPVLEIGVPFGTEGRAEARLKGKLAGSARLTLAAEPPAGMRVSVLSVDGTESAELRVTFADVGTHAGSLRFSTGLDQPTEIPLSYLVKVVGTLTVSPTNPVLDLSVPGKGRTVLTVRSTQAGFALRRAEVVEGPFAAVVRRTSDGFDVEVSIVAEKFAKATHGATGRIRIVSNDRSEPEKELQLFALGRPD